MTYIQKSILKTLNEVLGVKGKSLYSSFPDVFAGTGGSTLNRCYQLIEKSRLSKELPSGTKSDEDDLNFHMWWALREQYDVLASSCPSGDIEQDCYIPIFEGAYALYLDVISTWNSHHYIDDYRRFVSSLYLVRVENGEKVTFEADVMTMLYLMIKHSDYNIVNGASKLCEEIEKRYSHTKGFRFMYRRVWGFSSVLNKQCIPFHKDAYIEYLETKVAKQEQELHMLNATRTEVQQFTPPQQTLYIGRVDTLNTNPNIFPNQQPFYNQR